MSGSGAHPDAGEVAEGEGEDDGGACCIGEGHDVDEHDHADLAPVPHAHRRARDHLVAAAARLCVQQDPLSGGTWLAGAIWGAAAEGAMASQVGLGMVARA